MKPKFTIKDFNKMYPDDEACLGEIFSSRYGDLKECPTCKKKTKFYKVRNRKCYACKYCGYQIHPLANTIFHKSSTSLKDWFYAVFLTSTTRCGISAKQLERELGVTYKTAWRMFKQIRLMMNEDIMNLLNEVEVDETYVGGKHKGKRGRGSENKTIVFGIAERNGKVYTEVVPNVQARTLLPIIKEKVLPDSTIYSDDLPSYDRILRMGFNHKRINHRDKVYVIGNASTNTIEGFWSLIKRGIDGVHHSVSKKYLQQYVNSYSFRWNHRDNEKPMFFQILSRLASSSKA